MDFKRTQQIDIVYPMGLDAEFGAIQRKAIEGEDGTINDDVAIQDELDSIIPKLMDRVCSTSSSDLVSLLEERRNQVKLLEETLPQIEGILNKYDVNGSEFVIMFQID